MFLAEGPEVFLAKAWRQERGWSGGEPREEAVLLGSRQKGEWHEARSGSRRWVLWTLGLSQSMGSRGTCRKWQCFVPSEAGGQAWRQGDWLGAESGSLSPREPTLCAFRLALAREASGRGLTWCLLLLWCHPEVARAGREALRTGRTVWGGGDSFPSPFTGAVCVWT